MFLWSTDFVQDIHRKGFLSEGLSFLWIENCPCKCNLLKFFSKYLFEFEFGFEIECNQVAWFILEKKMHSNNLVRYTNTWYDRKYLTTFPNKPNLLFCPHKIPKLELLYHLRMWARRDLCIGNHLQQSSSKTLGKNYFWSWILYCCLVNFLKLLF